MAHVRTLTYDDKSTGRKVLPFPPELPCSPYVDELALSIPQAEHREILLKLANISRIYERCSALADYLETTADPHRILLSIAALAVSGELSGLRLLYGALLAIPPVETMIEELAGFRSVTRLMERITRKLEEGKEPRESELWFKQKVTLLSMSHSLPNSERSHGDRPWIGWSEGVRLALDSADDRWDEAVIERAKVELEALDLRLKILAASLDPDSGGNLTFYLYSLSAENKWRMQALEQSRGTTGGSTLVLERRLGEHWSGIVSALRSSGAGSILAGVFDLQKSKTFPQSQLNTGSALMRALIMHPLLRKTQREPDIVSCIALLLGYAGRGALEIMIPAGRRMDNLLHLPGFSLRERLLAIDLRRIPGTQFVGNDEEPVDVDWTDVTADVTTSYRSLVLQYIDNDNFLMELLGNPKAINKPGVVSTIALRCRSIRVLSAIANQRQYYTGIANKDVPLNMLMNPAKISITSLRKFIHVRYVDRPTLQRLSNRGGQIREEVRLEISRYIATMK